MFGCSLPPIKCGGNTTPVNIAMQSILIPISIRFNTNTENGFKFILSRIKSKISVIKVKAGVKELSHIHAISHTSCMQVMRLCRLWR